MADKKPRKYQTILETLLNGTSLNRFEAERIGDHCLHTTISDLQHKHGINIHGERETVPCRFGTTSVVRYYLPASEHEKARKLLKLAPVAGS